MSGSGQSQFRYTQTPSKVVHLRNLPWECHDEELVELCNPFGKVINTKGNVGANKNQAFVEFVSVYLQMQNLVGRVIWIWFYYLELLMSCANYELAEWFLSGLVVGV